MTLADQLAYDLDRALSPSVHVTQARTVADARTVTQPTAATMLLVACGATSGDGLGGVFAWEPASTTTDDSGVSSIQITGVTTGRFKRTQATTAGIADGAVTTAKLADLSVTTAKLAALAVTDAKLAADAVTTAKILNSAVTAAKIADDTITDAKIAATPTTGGLATYLRTIKAYTPLGTSADAAAIQALVTAMSGVGEVRIKPGTALITSTVNLTSSLVLSLHPNTVLSSTMSSGSFTNFILGFLPTLSGTTTLSSAASAGAQAVASATSFAVGDWMWLGQSAGSSTYVAAQYQIVAKSGVGPYTYTLDRPLTRSWNSGTYFRALTSRLKDCVIEGNGALLEGGGDRLLQIQGGWHCLVRGVRFAKTASYTPDYGLAFDLGCFETSAVDCSADGAANGFIIEAGERVSLVRCNARGGGIGLRINDSTDCSVVDSSASGYTSGGISITANATGGASSDASAGSARIMVRGGTYQKSAAGTGVSLAGYASDCTIDSVCSADNDINFDVGPTSLRNSLINCHSERAAAGSFGYGYYIHGPGTRLIAPSSSGDKFALYIAGSTVDVLDVAAPNFENYTTRAISIDTDPPASSWLNVTGGRMTSTTNTDAIDLRGPMNCLFDGLRLVLPAGGPIGIYVRATASSAVHVLRGVRMSQGGAGASGYAQAATGTCTLRLDGRNDLNVTTPTTIAATGYTNVGTVTANGATSVDVSYPDIKATDVVILTRKTDGGTPGNTPRVTIAAGSKFTINGDALDTSVYAYAIV